MIGPIQKSIHWTIFSKLTHLTKLMILKQTSEDRIKTHTHTKTHTNTHTHIYIYIWDMC